MKTITITAWNRPDYLKRTVESLRLNDTKGFALVALLDRGFDPACYEILHGIGFMPKHIVILDVHHGCNYASKHVIETAVNFGTSLNVHLEDDTVLAPDCLALVNWWEQQPVSAHSLLCPFRFGYNLPQNSLVALTNWFMQWGWSARPTILRTLLDDWMNDGKIWDSSVRATCLKHNYIIAQPNVSRVLHIGRDQGTYYTPERYDAEFHTQFSLSDGSQRDYAFT